MEYERWAAFGTYVGGVATPLTVLVAVFALIQSDRARKEQTAQLLAQGSKADILRFIEKIERDIESLLAAVNVNVHVEDKKVAHPGSDLLFRLSMLEWKEVIPTAKEILVRLEKSPDGLPRYDNQIVLFEMCSMVASHIARLRDHCDAYDEASGNNATSLYFARKYRVATERLSAKGYAVAIWRPATQPTT